MNRILPFVALYIFSFPIFSQEENKALHNGWTKEGNVQLLFNQSAFNKEWTGGGTSSLAGNLSFNYEENYRYNNFSWTNRILANYGLTKLRDDKFTRKTSDRLEINSIAGYQMKNSNWYYSLFTNFRTQFDKGYHFLTHSETGEITRTEYTRMLSPAYLQAGPGLMWKKDENLVFNIAPATARFIFVNKRFTTTPGYTDGDYFGVDSGESSRFELGASISAYLQLDIFENITLENNLNLYANYLDNPGNIDIDYLFTLNMEINRYFSANVLFQAVYDDNAVGAFQIREVMGLGIGYNF